MDVNTLRTLLTVACFAVFIGIVVWAYSARRRDRFSEAARVPLEEDGPGEARAAEATPEESRK